MGVGNPHRFTFNPEHWDWSMEHYERETHLFGPSRTEFPELITGTKIKSIEGQLLEEDTILSIQKTYPISLLGTPSSIDYNSKQKEFALTIFKGDIYITNQDFKT